MAENLYCPRCGNQFSRGISYCRTCGLSLDGVSEIVSGEAASAPVMTSRPNFKLMRIGIGLFIFGMAIGLINGALKDFGLFPQAYGKAIFLAMVAAGMLTMGAGFVFPTKRYAKPKRSNTPPDPETPSNTSKLPEQLDPAQASINEIECPKNRREAQTISVGSVTEGTTRNLDQHLD